MTADTLGGVWHYAIELAGALGAHDIEVALATMGAPLTSTQREQLAQVNNVRLYESALRLEWMREPWNDVALAGEWLLALEREVRPAVVHLNQFAFGALPFTAPTLLVAHSCVRSWWRAVHGEAAPREWARYGREVERGLRGATQVAAPTRAMLAALMREYRLAGSGLVLPNGRDASLFTSRAKQPFVLAAGRLWDAAKNLAALESVAPSLPWPVKVAGLTAHPDGGSREALHVKALGDLPPQALCETMGHAAIYALPARYEPFGLSVLEAALCECALVLGDIASLRETWGDAAVYVAPDDHDALGATLQRLIEDPLERTQRARAARSRALRYSPSRMASAYLAAYGRIQPAFNVVPVKELQCA